ncbi:MULTISPECIES: hypothetical protein [unclassified Chelatococcus]|uniref:hypothetical protein n=1 Tax=unclassified Chelatococcus TaxID=2638111 RepID=UPI001BCF6F9A|nr:MULTISPECIES: hypothetical protein [unclassified Chelatococcus]MBS7739014.1 hypothetical protein [Chelatococcus sp. HY11]MBX3543449.1 hypothetical protein [Chelatococcus sp.]MCO5076456.1 hypothetical protein [Chelatococcus sp.]
MLQNGDKGQMMMVFVPRTGVTGLAIGVAIVLGGLLAACNPVRDVAVSTGFGAKEPEPAQFVRESRRDDGGYLPVGVRAPDRTTKALPKADVEALTNSIDARRQANEAAGATARSMGAETNARPVPKPATLPAE